MKIENNDKIIMFKYNVKYTYLCNKLIKSTL